MDNYIGYGLVLVAGMYTVKKVYENRWSLLKRGAPLFNKGLDHFLELRRSVINKIEGKHVYCDDSQLIVTEIVIRHFDNEESMSLLDSRHHVIDIHLGESSNLDLKDLSIHIKGGQTSSRSPEFDQSKSDGFTLVDIYYHFHGHKFVFTCPAGEDKVKLYHPNEVKGHCGVPFESVTIEKESGEEHELDETLQGCLIDQINRYLGPLNDFHHGLRPIKVEWMNLKDLPFHKGDKLVLTTQLMETVELKWGTTLEPPDL